LVEEFFRRAPDARSFLQGEKLYPG